MFKIISPIIARFPKVNLEIFGSGGYASVRDLRASLAPISSQARFWGHQPNAASVYPLLDFVLSGLPEKEALGLNLIEAQFSGTPVIAVKAPPFIETVLDGSTGYLYADPREDGGNSFAQLLERILTQGSRPDPREATEHLEKFSFDAFRLRVSAALFAAGFEK
jgi:glycosyltransferase involved in cell wall biosynthesis